MVMIPIKTITLYRNNGDNSKFYFESADVIHAGNRYKQGPARPMMIKDIIAFSKAYNNSTKAIRYLEEPFSNVLNANFSELELTGISKESLELAWFTPKGPKSLFFEKGFSIKTGVYFLPTLIWVFKKGKLYVSASVDDYPNWNSKCYRSPFLNMYDDHSVCLGTTAIALKNINTIELAKKHIEKAFFASVFTQSLTNPFKCNTTAAYKIMEENQLPFEFWRNEPIELNSIWH
jgi:hypothetical protein